MSDESRQDTLDPRKVLTVVSQVGDGFGIDRTEQESAEHLVRLLAMLAPGVRIAVRTFQPTHIATLACATTGEEVLEGGLEEAGDAGDAYLPVFAGTSAGLAITVTIEDEQVGLVNLEAESDLPAGLGEAAEALVAVFRGSLRDRRLSRDAGFLRRWLVNTIDNANALIFVVDPQSKVTLINRALADLIGYGPEEVLGRDVGVLVPEGERRNLQRQIDAGLGGRSVNGIEVELLRKEGEPVPTIFNMARPADVASSVVAIGQDVSAIKMLEHQVMQAEKLASLGQLVAGVVHEINNPLTSITVYADYLIKKFRNGDHDANTIAMLEKIVEGSNRILKFTRDLVDYGKPTGSETDVLSLNEIVEQSVSFCEHVLDAVGADLTLNAATDLPPLYGVKDQLQQVVINLLTNACHSVQAGGRIVVTTSHPSSTHVAVEISDTGCGIPSSDLPAIFDPFFTTKTPGEGTGLGLSIVKKIIDSHNGTIMVESEVGRGTSFSIVLPTGRRDG